MQNGAIFLSRPWENYELTIIITYIHKPELLGSLSAANMHTCNELGLNVDLSADLETNFTWTPPLAAWQTEISLEGLEAITDKEFKAAFVELEQRDLTDARMLDLVIEGNEIEAGRVYDLDEFARVEKGVIPSTFEDDVEVVVPASGDTNWDIDTILLSKGVSSA